jgi:predicted MFS family arabinose efflux permease
MISCCGLYFLSKIIFWRATGFSAFLVERIILAITCAGLSGVDSSILYLSAPEGESQKIFGRYYALGTAGLLFSAWFYTMFIGSNYRLAGLCTAISYGLAALLTLGLSEVHNPDPEQRQSVRRFFSLLLETARDKWFLLFLIGDGLYCEAVQMITVWLNQNQYLRCGMNERLIGVAYIAVTLLSLGSAFSHRITKKLGKTPFVVGTFLVSGGCSVLLALSSSPWLSFFAIAGISTLYALVSPLITDLFNLRVVTRDRATQISIYAVVCDCVSAGANLVYGKVADATLPGAFLLGAVACVLACVTFLLCYRGKTE